MLTLSNAYLQFSFDEKTGYWSLHPQGRAGPSLDSARLGAIYHVTLDDVRHPVFWDGELVEAVAHAGTRADSPHGRLETLTVQARTSTEVTEPLAVTITFALPADHPCLLLRVEATNSGLLPVNLEVVDLVRVGPRFQPRSGRSGFWFGVRSFFEPDPGEDLYSPGPAGSLWLATASEAAHSRLAFFCNGYQSWSFAGALQAHMRQPSSIFGPLGEPKALNLVTPRFRHAGRFTSDMFGVLADRTSHAGLVAGFLSQRDQFSAVEVLLQPERPSLRLTAQCDDVLLELDESRQTDWAYLEFVDLRRPEPLGGYVQAVARENDARVPARTPVGWCSWYHYFDRVTQQDMLDNLAAIAKQRAALPLDFVQLDDGFQSQVGDWFETKPTFPDGLRWLAARIRAQGLMPGLWLAPYIVRSDARLLREHPEWFLRTARGRLVNAGYNWFRWCYALDPTHPAVRAHVRRLIKTAVEEWGFPYLKLDFLFAAALPGQRHNVTLTRAQAMRQALHDIRAAAGPETFLLGCGCPLGPAVGLVDAMRVSTDVAPDWDPSVLTPHLAPLLQREMDFVGVRNAIRNTINRAPLHGRWWLNDPDCLLVRDHDTRLTEDEVRSLATVIALSGGQFLVSDDMRRLKPERQRYIASLLPVLGTSARAPGWLDAEMPDLLVLPLSGPAGDWVVAAAFNWSRLPKNRSVALEQLGLSPDQDYYVSDFWDRRHWILPAGQPLRLKGIPRHGTHLLALRPRVVSRPTLVASSFHFSQGREISAWEAKDGCLALRLDLGRQADGELRLALPVPPSAATVAGQMATLRDLGQGVYALGLGVNQRVEVTVQC